jgi:hypothetical protein
VGTFFLHGEILRKTKRCLTSRKVIFLLQIASNYVAKKGKCIYSQTPTQSPAGECYDSCICTEVWAELLYLKTSRKWAMAFPSRYNSLVGLDTVL